MVEIREMPEGFHPEITTQHAGDRFLRFIYYRERSLECVDGASINCELGFGYKLPSNGTASSEQDLGLRLSVWQARELIRTCQQSKLSELGIMQFECTEEEECL